MHEHAQKSTEFGGWRLGVVRASGWLLGVLAAIALAAMLSPRVAQWNNGLGAKLIIVAAGIVPPAYFWFEYFALWKSAPKAKRPPLDEYKHGQEASRNLWLAFVGLLITLLLKG